MSVISHDYLPPSFKIGQFCFFGKAVPEFQKQMAFSEAGCCWGLNRFLFAVNNEPDNSVIPLIQLRPS